MYAIVADGDFLILTIIGPDGKELHQYCSQPAECFADGKVSLEDVRRDWPYTREIDTALLVRLAKAGTGEADIHRPAAIDFATEQLFELGKVLGIPDAINGFPMALDRRCTEAPTNPMS